MVLLRTVLLLLLLLMLLMMMVMMMMSTRFVWAKNPVNCFSNGLVRCEIDPSSRWRERLL